MSEPDVDSSRLDELGVGEELRTVPAEIVDPITGEIIDPHDADALIEAYQRIDARDKELYIAKWRIRLALAALTSGDTKTRRVRGHRCRAVVEMPDDAWDQARLKEAWNAYEGKPYRDEVLAIGTVKVKLREYKKIAHESGPPDFEAFKALVTAANQGPSGAPSIKVEA